MAYKDFQAAQVLTASEVQTYLMDQSVIVFANAAARTSAITLPTEGMFTYLQDTDELQVYNGSSWLTLVVTSDDDSFTTSGSIIANNAGVDGGIALRQWTASSGYQSLATTNMSGNEYVMLSDGVDTFVGAGTGGSVNLRPSANSTAGAMNVTTTQTTTTGDFKISKRNPVLQIEETGGADNVDINLYQSGSSTEGLQIRYESGTGHSRIKNIYSSGVLALHTANNTSKGIEIGSDGVPRYVQSPNPYGWHTTFQPLGTQMVIGASGASGMSWSGANVWINVGSVGVTVPNNCTTIMVVYGFTCYVAAGGSVLTRVYYSGSGAASQLANFRNYTYDHFCIAGANAVSAVGGTGTVYLQVYGNGITVIADSNDSHYFTVHTV